MITVHEALSRGTQAISQCKISATPLLDASLLLCKSTGLKREELYIRSRNTISPEICEAYYSLIERRCNSEPVAYLLGEREFFGRSFKVSPAVLVPRGDSEILVEAALERLPLKSQAKVLDLCCGSGCIGITLAKERELVNLALSDISTEALEVAGENNRALLGGRARLFEGSLFDPLKGEKFSLIVTNPPYLSDAWYNECSAEVKREPSLALLGGAEDGLSLIREIIREAPRFLEDGGSLLIECDWRQHPVVLNLLEERGFKDLASYSDLASLWRVAGGTYRV